VETVAVGAQAGTSHRIRYRQVAEVLARHGLGYLLGQLGLERLVPFHRGLLGHPRRAEPYTRPEHLRMALEDLGPAFIKLGQLLSTRADLLPPEHRAELAKLLDQAPPVPTADVAAVIEAELGEPPDRVFAWFDPTPLAAASIGQAHLARAHCGLEVVVKVRRPRVVEGVEEDLAVIQGLARMASRHAARTFGHDLEALTAEFASVLRSELDYVREGESAERFARNFAGSPEVHIPAVLWEATTHRVLTLERISGIRIDDAEGLARAGVDPHELAVRAAHVILKMVFEDGFFHADPHPGNFFMEAGGRLGLIDFGMVGALDRDTQDRLAELMDAITSTDPDRLADAFLDLGAVRGPVDRAELGRDLGRPVAAYAGKPLGELPVGETIGQALDVARRHRIVLPTNLALLFKAFIVADGVARSLDPSFQLAAVMAPYAKSLAVRRYAPSVLAPRLRQAGSELVRLLERSPRQVRRLLDDLERGGLEVGVRPVAFEPVLGRLEALANRVVLAVVAAAFVNGLAVLMTFYHPAGWGRWIGAAFAVGVAVAFGAGGYLAWTMVRGSRRPPGAGS
jgi:ubiquinone biosynthesis protein